MHVWTQRRLSAKLLILGFLGLQLIFFPSVVARADDVILAPENHLLDERGKKVGRNVVFEPGTIHHLQLQITNPVGSATARIQVTANNQQTTDDGQIDEAPGVPTNRLLAGAKDATDVFMLEPNDTDFTLKAGKTRRVDIVMKVPDEQIKGKQIYQIEVDASATDPLATSDGQFEIFTLAVRNKASRIEKAKLKFASFTATDYDGRRGFIVRVENPTGATYRRQSISAVVQGESTGSKIAKRTLRKIEVAPYSYFNFFVPYVEMQAGDYHVDLQVNNNRVKTLRTTVSQLPAGKESRQVTRQTQWLQRLFVSAAVIGPIVIILVGIGYELHGRRRRMTK